MHPPLIHALLVDKDVDREADKVADTATKEVNMCTSSSPDLPALVQIEPVMDWLGHGSQVCYGLLLIHHSPLFLVIDRPPWLDYVIRFPDTLGSQGVWGTVWQRRSDDCLQSL